MRSLFEQELLVKERQRDLLRDLDILHPAIPPELARAAR